MCIKGYVYSVLGSLRFLVLLVAARDYTRVRDRYPESYYDIVESDRMPELLYMLKSGRYRQIF